MMVLSLALWICSDWIFGFFNKDFGNFVVAMNWIREYVGYGMVMTLFSTLWNMYKAILSLKLMGSCYFGIFIKLCLV